MAWVVDSTIHASADAPAEADLVESTISTAPLTIGFDVSPLALTRGGHRALHQRPPAGVCRPSAASRCASSRSGAAAA